MRTTDPLKEGDRVMVAYLSGLIDGIVGYIVYDAKERMKEIQVFEQSGDYRWFAPRDVTPVA